MKILMTGGTGLIGKELGKSLARKGHKIVVLTRNPEKSKAQTPYPHEAVKWDGETDVVAAQHYDGVDAVIHMAGVGVAEQRWSSSFKYKLEDSRILATQNLLKNAPQSLKIFIGASAIGYYPASDSPLKEDNASADHFFGQLCKDWEDKAYTCLQGYKTRIAHLRTGIVLSPQGGALEQMLPPLRSGLAGPLAGGKQMTSWIDIEDVVSMYMFALENASVIGPVNAVAPHPVTNKFMTKEIGKIISRPVFSPVPKFSLRLVVGEFAKYLVMSQNISSKKIQDLGFKFKYEDIKKSLEKNIPQLGSGEKRFYSEQFIYQSLDKVFPFFSTEKNLEKITPPSLKFKVLSKTTDQIEQGTLINYKLKLDGIVPIKWQTEIIDWNPPYSFVDQQKKGPYHKWHHTHSFEEIDGGTLMTDTIDYSLPLGILGRLVAGWKVDSDVNKIFSYRSKVIEEIF